MSELGFGIPGTLEEWILSLVVVACVIFVGKKII